jgi:hypothetical protein
MSTLDRADEIEAAYFYLKSIEFGPLATEREIRQSVEAALMRLREDRKLIDG